MSIVCAAVGGMAGSLKEKYFQTFDGNSIIGKPVVCTSINMKKQYLERGHCFFIPING